MRDNYSIIEESHGLTHSGSFSIMKNTKDKAPDTICRIEYGEFSFGIFHRIDESEQEQMRLKAKRQAKYILSAIKYYESKGKTKCEKTNCRISKV